MRTAGFNAEFAVAPAQLISPLRPLARSLGTADCGPLPLASSQSLADGYPQGPVHSVHRIPKLWSLKVVRDCSNVKFKEFTMKIDS